jgi:ABC-2 type transport system ATP-binding protein
LKIFSVYNAIKGSRSIHEHPVSPLKTGVSLIQNHFINSCPRPAGGAAIPVDIIDIRSVSKRFGNVQALDNVTLKVQEGEFYGLFGPNGAGKTTLLSVLTGQLTPDTGSIRVAGVDSNDPMELKRRVGVVPEAESPPTFLTAQETLELVCRIHGVDDIKVRVEEWLGFFDIRDKRDVLSKDLSKGQRQKLMLASAFIHEPSLLLLDEPFINLDPIYQRRVRDYLESIVEGGVTVFMCTHILEIAEKLCTRVAVIHEGSIIREGTMEAISAGSALEDVFLELVGEGARVT